MKITLKANNEIHRQIAMMCVGWYFFNGCKLIGVIKEGFVAETPYLEYMDEITLDLSKVELDLRMAIGLPVEFVVTNHTWHSPFGITWDSGSRYFIDNFKEPNHWDIKLSTDWLKSVGVEVEE